MKLVSLKRGLCLFYLIRATCAFRWHNQEGEFSYSFHRVQFSVKDILKRDDVHGDIT